MDTHRRTPVVALRRVEAGDEEFLWTWIHGTPDAEWKRWDAPYFHAAEQAAPMGRAAFARSFAPWLDDADRRIVTVDGAAIGLATRHEEAPAGGGWWELGILLFDPSRWGGGIGTRALAAWTEATLTETDAHVLTLTTWSGNARMAGAAGRVGFRMCARVPESRAWDGRRWDSLRFALLRGDHEGEQASAPEPPAPRPELADLTVVTGRIPDAAALRALYDAVGWTAYTRNPDALAAGVAGSACVATAWAGQELVGLARVVSDGHTIAYLQDVLVHPERQRQGVAGKLLDAVFAPFAHVRQQVLITDEEPGQRAFYEAGGFRQFGGGGPVPGRTFVRFAG